jgi:ketosteroid isomerase-like protein
MRKLLSLTFMLLAVLPVLANDNEAKIKATVENRYQQWLTADNKKDAEAITDLYDENAVLMPSREDPVLGKAAIGEWYKKLFADPHFVPFTLALQWNSFHVVGDIAIETGVFDGVDEEWETDPFPRQEPDSVEEAKGWCVEDLPLYV